MHYTTTIWEKVLSNADYCFVQIRHPHTHTQRIASVYTQRPLFIHARCTQTHKLTMNDLLHYHREWPNGVLVHHNKSRSIFNEMHHRLCIVCPPRQLFMNTNTPNGKQTKIDVEMLSGGIFASVDPSSFCNCWKGVYRFDREKRNDKIQMVQVWH